MKLLNLFRRKPSKSQMKRLVVQHSTSPFNCADCGPSTLKKVDYDDDDSVNFLPSANVAMALGEILSSNNESSPDITGGGGDFGGGGASGSWDGGSSGGDISSSD